MLLTGQIHGWFRYVFALMVGKRRVGNVVVYNQGLCHLVAVNHIFVRFESLRQLLVSTFKSRIETSYSAFVVKHGTSVAPIHRVVKKNEKHPASTVPSCLFEKFHSSLIFEEISWSAACYCFSAYRRQNHGMIKHRIFW